MYKHLHALVGGLSLLSAFTFAAVLPSAAESRDLGLVLRQATTTTSRVADAQCTNGPTSRSCWRSGFSIVTDFDAKLPPAGKTVTHNLEITNTTLAPDGIERLVMAINGQYPGPTLYADWGDTMVVNVKNSLQHNGTSIHWHGLRMLNTCQHDGVNGVTECPIAPGETKQYKIRCTQHGTSWYHSHHSAQYGDGVVGAIVINGPASANYDTDLGTLSLTDWFYDTAFALNVRALHTPGPPPQADNALINGTMKNARGGGSYHVTKVTKGKKHRLRLINTSIDHLFHVSIDNHKFKVITSDFVPIKPFDAETVAIGIGQRYDIIVNADQAVGSYWLRADIGTACGRNRNAGNIKSIIRYDAASTSDPTSTGIAKSTACYDEQATPYVGNQVPEDQFDSAVKRFSAGVQVTTVNGPLVQWLINGSDIRVDWSKPSLQYVQENNYEFEKKMNVYEINQVNTWTFWVIQTVPNDPANTAHPIHLHGHDFYVLGFGSGQWDGNKAGLKFSNPMRRDTATLPAGGYLVIGFPADNPGVWLMHCHIAWHVGGGFSLQFLERKNEIISSIGDLGDFNAGCESWKKYWNGPRMYGMDDSGL